MRSTNISTKLASIRLFKRHNPYRRSLSSSVVPFLLIVDIVLLLALIVVYFDLDKSAIIALLSVILAVVFPVFVEKVQRPSIRITSATKEQTVWKTDIFWVIKLHLIHDPLPNDFWHLWARMWLERRSATRCRGTIRFMTVTGDPVTVVDHEIPNSPFGKPTRTIGHIVSQHNPNILENNSQAFAGTISPYQLNQLTTTISGAINQPNPSWSLDGMNYSVQENVDTVNEQPKERELIPMVLRWAGSIQPSEPAATIKIDGRQGTIHHYITEIDIAPDEENAIDVAIQYDGDKNCYGWNNETYFLPSPKNSKWRLPPGEYIIQIRVNYGDRVLQERFLLKNTGKSDGLTVKPITSTGHPNQAVQLTPLARP